ncbi:hypothetical protein [Thiomicrospira sp. ALE5]|uniref:hypothetical protein n=1 Tax=Thiomicrospira sp. ALE5 TaxID=748650 RepID=UPI0008E4780D|nr:hypothetical protein [Thiomicrospira sp. ALE5]SFR52653.1 hypothetical protein SAMN03092900_0725 [Thiomicrospira sp. ALE5]
MKIIFFFLFTFFSLNVSAFVNTSSFDYCSSTPDRKTIFYIDISSINKDDNSWATEFLNKTNFLPREKVEIFFIDTFNNVIIEGMTEVCYPDLSDSDIALERESRSRISRFFTNDIEESIKRDQRLFNSRLRSVLSNALRLVNENEGRVPSSNVLNLLSFEQSRFSNQYFNRVIIYSDFNNSNFESLLVGNYEELNLPLKFSEVFIYGVNSNSVLSDSRFKILTNSVSDLLKRNNITLSNFSLNLNLGNQSFEGLNTWQGLLADRDGNNALIRLRLVEDINQNFFSSWMFVNQLGYVSITGSKICTQQNCSYSLVLNDDLNPLKRDDKVDLILIDHNNLSGQITAPDGLHKIMLEDGTLVDVIYNVSFEKSSSSRF